MSGGNFGSGYGGGYGGGAMKGPGYGQRAAGPYGGRDIVYCTCMPSRSIRILFFLYVTSCNIYCVAMKESIQTHGDNFIMAKEIQN